MTDRIDELIGGLSCCFTMGCLWLWLYVLDPAWRVRVPRVPGAPAPPDFPGLPPGAEGAPLPLRTTAPRERGLARGRYLPPSLCRVCGLTFADGTHDECNAR